MPGQKKSPSPAKGKLSLNENLLGTETEKHATSKSLFGDHKARISSNVSAIHDRTRLTAYKKILQSLRGKTVLHLGCGMGLLSMMAARALAKHVVAVDTSAIVDCARVVADQNQLKNITFLKGSIKELSGKNSATEMPHTKFDVIICEWMGAFLTNEKVLDELIYCREHLLAEGGILCPGRSSIHVVGISDYDYLQDTVEYWDNVYGFTMKAMKRLVTEEASTCHIPTMCIATNSCRAHTIDAATITAEKKDFSFEFSIQAKKHTTIHFLTFYVDCQFTHPTDATANFSIDAHPGGPNAWTEVSCPLEHAMPVEQGDTISGTVSVKPGEKVTEIGIVAKCHGSVTNVDVTGRYFYTY